MPLLRDTPAALLAPRRGRRPSVAVVVPTVDEQATIGPICRALVRARELGVCDRVIVADDSADLTPRIAAQAGADVIRQADVRADLGPVLGKGDAMWRALQMVDEDIVVYLDGDTRGFDAGVVEALVGAVAEGARFVKADYDRPWDTGTGVVLPHGGGRVTELTAKPLLRRFFPGLAHLGQPLAGEIAAPTELLRRLPFVTGYGVDVALLIDAARAAGSELVDQVRVAARQNRHRPLAELSAMADVVADTILARAGLIDAPLVERPALDRAAPAH